MSYRFTLLPTKLHTDPKAFRVELIDVYANNGYTMTGLADAYGIARKQMYNYVNELGMLPTLQDLKIDYHLAIKSNRKIFRLRAAKSPDAFPAALQARRFEWALRAAKGSAPDAAKLLHMDQEAFEREAAALGFPVTGLRPAVAV